VLTRVLRQRRRWGSQGAGPIAAVADERWVRISQWSAHPGFGIWHFVETLAQAREHGVSGRQSSLARLMVVTREVRGGEERPSSGSRARSQVDHGAGPAVPDSSRTGVGGVGSPSIRLVRGWNQVRTVRRG
jgi:hypothetical protein